MAEYNLKSPHVSCLYYLYKRPGMTAAELCELCEEDKAAASRSILYLEKNGYLSREGIGSRGATRGGGRHYRVPLMLTEQGSDVAARIVERIDRVLEAVAEGVSAEDRATMYRTLEQINRNLRTICEEYGDEPVSEE
jgi:DNA-binding MarR family transcriptional regulator